MKFKKNDWLKKHWWKIVGIVGFLSSQRIQLQAVWVATTNPDLYLRDPEGLIFELFGAFFGSFGLSWLIFKISVIVQKKNTKSDAECVRARILN